MTQKPRTETHKTPHPNDTFDAEKARSLRNTNPFDTRNVRDEFKGMDNADIISSLKKNNLVAVLTNDIKDFNYGSVVRNANAFGVGKIVFSGSRRYDRRGTVGAHHYVDIDYIHNPHDIIDTYREKGYTIIAAEYDERYTMSSLFDYTWDDRTAVIFGEEGKTIPDDILEKVDDIVMIPMWGTVRSINVGSASAVFFSHYASQHMV